VKGEKDDIHLRRLAEKAQHALEEEWVRNQPLVIQAHRLLSDTDGQEVSHCIPCHTDSHIDHSPAQHTTV
jgi:hypothetical protein